jgi:ElaB/YqjD/DUF883 family membrane-anchored ribosome-binding protein
MFGTNRLHRRSRPERVADQAWEYLLSAAGSARDSARSAGRRTSHLAEDASNAMGSVTDEAGRRASAAFDALAGRRPATPWTLIAVAGVVGAAIGWAAASAARTALSRGGGSDTEREPDTIEFVDTERPVSLDT